MLTSIFLLFALLPAQISLEPVSADFWCGQAEISPLQSQHQDEPWYSASEPADEESEEEGVDDHGPADHLLAESMAVCKVVSLPPPIRPPHLSLLRYRRRFSRSPPDRDPFSDYHFKQAATIG